MPESRKSERWKSLNLQNALSLDRVLLSHPGLTILPLNLHKISSSQVICISTSDFIQQPSQEIGHQIGTQMPTAAFRSDSIDLFPTTSNNFPSTIQHLTIRRTGGTADRLPSRLTEINGILT